MQLVVHMWVTVGTQRVGTVCLYTCGQMCIVQATCTCTNERELCCDVLAIIPGLGLGLRGGCISR